LAFLNAKLGYEKALSGIDHLACALGLLWAWMLSRRGALSTHAYMRKIENGADADLMGITCYWSAPRRAACIGISQQWRAHLTDGNLVTPAQVNSIKINEESVNLLAAAEVLSGRRVLCLLGFSECEMSALGT
jgi:hypothetical protein